jgi:hypothetical protein
MKTLHQLVYGKDSVFDDYCTDIDGNRLWVRLHEALRQGWQLDLFSTMASRKAQGHMVVGPYRLVRNLR